MLYNVYNLYVCVCMCIKLCVYISLNKHVIMILITTKKDFAESLGRTILALGM